MSDQTPPRVYRDSTHYQKVRRGFERATPAALNRAIAGAHVQEAWHLAVIRVCEKFNVTPIDHFHYVGYADGLKYKVMKYEWLMDRALEHTILRRRWEGRGLRPEVLDAIDDMQPWKTGKLP